MIGRYTSKIVNVIKYLSKLVGIVKENEEDIKDFEKKREDERDFETYSPTGVPRNVLRYAGLERTYHPAEAREKDKEPPRKDDYVGAPTNRIGDSQIFYFERHHSEGEQ